MPLDKKGFLGNQIEEISKKIIKECKDFFELCYDLNNYAQKIKNEFKIHRNNGQEVIATCLFIKILNGFQAIIILARYGLVTESKVLLRSILESLFILKVACEDENFITEYIKTDEVRRLKLINAARNNPDAMFKSLRNYATEDVRSTLKKKIKRENIREIITRDLARTAGLEALYDSAYRLLSSDIHTAPRSLKKYLVIDDKENITSFNLGPWEKDVDKVLGETAHIFLYMFNPILKLFSLEKTSELGNIEDRFAKLIDLVPHTEESHP